MEDLAANEASGRILTRTLDAGRPLGVVCHAPAALLAARREDGSWPFAGSIDTFSHIKAILDTPLG